jgi:hypothetical protein
MWYGVPLATLAVLFWAYGPTMHTGFLFDDTKQQFAPSSASDPRSLWLGPVRPLLMFTYWINTRISLQDTQYTKFNGGGSNYDGFGRNAGDNNSLYLLVWFNY